ncbi:MAG TPA: histidine phosphatase family protein [Segetibacter sp.]|jgi:phosphohistidine phosphatase
MKRLLLVRHAKSSWSSGVEDFDRPLNERGLHDAPAMAKRLLKQEIKIDTFVTSPAKRALTTATLFAGAYNKSPNSLIIIPTLYEPTTIAFFNAVETLDDSLTTVALFSHNPGITNFANKLTATSIDDMPTCAIFAINCDTKKWADFALSTKKFWFFDYPKA